jgi:response regulator RpfG family c-di-GMP phosphodiesterase
MPVMDGFEMIRQFRRSPALQHIIIIVTSASAFSKDATQSIETGGNDFLPKPIHFDSLLTKIEKHLDIEWIYEELNPHQINYEANTLHRLLKFDPINTNPNFDNTFMVSPSSAEMEILFDLVMQGNINGLAKRAAILQEQDLDLVPFATELQKLATEFQIKKIKEFIDFYRGNPHN